VRLSYYQQQRCSREGREGREEERKERERGSSLFFLFKFESVDKIIQKYDDAHGGVCFMSMIVRYMMVL